MRLPVKKLASFILLIFLLLPLQTLAATWECSICIPNSSCTYGFSSAKEACGGSGVPIYTNGGPGFRCETNNNKWGGCGGTCDSGNTADATGSGTCANTNTEPDCSNAGNPITTSSGAKRETHVDYKYSGGTSLELKRTYYYQGGEAVWHFPYRQRIEKTPYATWHSTYGFTQFNGLYLTAYRDNGVMYYYEGGLADSTTYTYTPRLTYSPLKLTVDFASNAELGGHVTNYHLTLQDGTVEKYDGQGRLVLVTTPQGLTQTITYGTNAITITDSSTGIKLDYTLDTSDRVTQAVVTYPSTPSDITLTYSYTYDSVSGLIDVVTYPDTTTIDYGYGENSAPDQALTSWKDEEGITFASWEYDASGYAKQSKHGSNAEKTTISYNTDTNGAVLDATITNVDGKQKKFHFADLGSGVRKIERVEGVGATGCMPSDSYTTYDVDDQMQTLTEGVDLLVTPKDEGVVTRFVYGDATRDHLITEKITGLVWGDDDASRPWNTSSPVLSNLDEQAESLKVVTTWHASRELVTKREYYGRRWASGQMEWYNYRTLSYSYDDGTTNCDGESSASWRVCEIEDIDEVYGVSRGTQYSYTHHSGTKVLQQKLVKRVDNYDPVTTTTLTTYAYNSKGQMTSSTNALSQVTSYSNYNEFGLPETITDPNNVVTTLAYDNRGRLTSTEADDGGLDVVTSYTYYDNGLLEKVTLADGSWTKYTYDAARYLTNIENNHGEHIDLVPSDHHGQWEKMTVCNGTCPSSGDTGVVSRAYREFDKLGRLSSVKNAADEEKMVYGYDRDGNRTTQVRRGDNTQSDGTDPDIARLYDDNDIATLWEYDDRNRLTRTLGGFNCTGLECTLDSYNNLDELPPSGVVDVIYAYNVLGQIKSVTDANNIVTTYHYNGFGEVIRENSKDRGTITYSYDVSGNVSQKNYYAYIDPGSLVTGTAVSTIWYAYDDLNRLTRVYYDDDTGSTNHVENVVYTYDEDDAAHGKGEGRLTSIADHAGDTDYKYDALGRVIEETVAPAGTTTNLVTAYTYNSVGQVLTETYTPGNFTFNHSYTSGRFSKLDFTDQLSTSRDLVTNVSYKAFSGMSAYESPMATTSNSLEFTRSYDLDGRLSQLNVYLHSTADFDTDYGYDDYGNIHSITDEWAGSSADQSFEYNALRHLTQATGLYGQYRYTYDDVGNRLKRELYRIDPNTTEDYGDTGTEVYTETYYYEDSGGTGTNTPANFVSNRLLKVDRENVEDSTELRERTFEYDERGNIDKDIRKDQTTTPSATTITVTPVYGKSNRMTSVDEQ